MRKLLSAGLLAAGAYLLWRWYERETLSEVEGVVRLQSEHEHFHLHGDLPPGFERQPGDTGEIMHMPRLNGQSHGEITYTSPIKLSKASWLRRTRIKRSSLIEVDELVEHP